MNKPKYPESTFGIKVRAILKQRKIPTTALENYTGIGRRVLYREGHRRNKATLLAIAYYLQMDIEDLVSGTDAEEDWYR